MIVKRNFVCIGSQIYNPYFIGWNLPKKIKNKQVIRRNKFGTFEKVIQVNNSIGFVIRLWIAHFFYNLLKLYYIYLSCGETEKTVSSLERTNIDKCLKTNV